MNRSRAVLAFAVAAFVLGHRAFAAENQANPLHYVYHGQPRDLPLDASRIAVQWRDENAATRNEAWPGAAASRLGRVTPAGVGGWSLLEIDEAAIDVETRTGEAIDIKTRTGETAQEAASRAAPGIHARIIELLALPEVAFASPVFHGTDGGWVIVTPEILLRFRPEHSAANQDLITGLLPEAAILDTRFGGMPGACRLRSSSRDGFEVLAHANRLARDPRVLWAEPDMQFTGRHAARPPDLGALYLPNDPGFGQAWGIRNTGQFGGTAGMDMDGDVAWDITQGIARVKVLVLDVGVQQDHPDLNLTHGADFTGEARGGGPGNACDNHGTPVAGCIAAVIDNALGTVGIAPRCPVLSARIGIADGGCTGLFLSQPSWTVYALAWGFVRGARVSNNSNGYGFFSNAIDDAYASTRDGGMIHFSAAGNGGQAPLGYPASLPAVLAVGALEPTGALAGFSNFGPDVEVIAPGVLVSTTDRSGSPGWVSGDYVLANGTSFSSPYAAGVAALIASQDTTRTAAQIEDLLVRGCRDLGAPGFDPIYSHGLVNAATSLSLGQAYQVGVGSTPVATALAGAPNPFANGVTLRLTLATAGRATLDIYDVTGRRLRRLAKRELVAGSHRFEWDGRDDSGSAAPAGLYFVRLETVDGTLNGRLVRLAASTR